MAMGNPLPLEVINGGNTQLFALKSSKCCALEFDRFRLRIKGRSSARVLRTSRVTSGAMVMVSSLEPIHGGGTQLSVLKGCKCSAFEFGQLRLRIEGRGGARVRVSSSLNGRGIDGVEDGGSDDAAMWLREKLPLQLERDGVEIDASRRIADACADACARFLATGRAFDPMMLMDAMEEEIERRDLRGDEFLPFELGKRAAKVLTERWNALPVAERPKAYRQQAYVNKKDVVDFEKWPKNLNLP